jgi:hypothetical protein
MEHESRLQHPKPVHFAIIDRVHRHRVQGGDVAEKQFRRANKATAGLRAIAVTGRMGARTLMAIKLMVGDRALATVMGTFYHGQRDNVIHNGAWAEATTLLAHLALLAGELGKASAAG